MSSVVHSSNPAQYSSSVIQKSSQVNGYTSEIFIFACCKIYMTSTEFHYKSLISKANAELGVVVNWCDYSCTI